VANLRVARRYAEAVFDLARESGNYDAWQRDLTTLAETASDPATGYFFANPSIPANAKLNALNTLLPDANQQEARNLARMLIGRHRFQELPLMLRTFEELRLLERGIAIAEVTTAVELTPQEQANVQRGLERIVGRTIEMRARVDPDIIGGIVARIGDQLIDGSAASQLRNLRMALSR
jgi:F-type H+-transporting ATPase subunit delta